MGLGGKIIDFSGLYLSDDMHQAGGVSEITMVKEELDICQKTVKNEIVRDQMK